MDYYPCRQQADDISKNAAQEKNTSKRLDKKLCKISEIMKKKRKNGPTGGHLGFITAKLLRNKKGYPCVRHYILFYIHGPAILHFFELSKYHNHYNSKWPLNGHIKIVCSRKIIRSLADIAEHICQIKRRSEGNFFLKRANEFFFISGHSK